MRTVAVPMLRDNYGWLLVAEGTARAVIVDPSEDAPVLEVAAREGVALVGALLTHHHADHVGGVEGLRRARPDLVVAGPAADAARLPALDLPLADGQRFSLGGLDGLALAVPCHTRGHLAYVFEGPDGPALFSGDTLFGAGCGRFFEGTAADMRHALHAVLGALPDATLVHCGHEYTASNLAFAAWLEPGSAAVEAKALEVAALRAAGRPSVPTRLGDERRYNPFLRVDDPALVAAARRRAPDLASDDPVEVLAAVRALKDRWTP